MLESIVDLFPPTALSYLSHRLNLSMEAMGREAEPMTF